MKRVVIESPYNAPTSEDIARNVEYARACVRDSLMRGEAPIASHLLHTQPGILEDQTPSERAMGIEAGLAWTTVADLVVVYADLGISAGMLEGIKRATRDQIGVEYRRLRGVWQRPFLMDGLVVNAYQRMKQLTSRT